MGMSKKDILAMLGQVPLFEGFSRKELEALYNSAKTTEFPPGKTLVEEGATGVGFHLVLEGEATVTVGGRRRATLRAGDYFGEMSLVDGGPRSATVRAETVVRTLGLTSWAFLPLLDEHPTMARKMLLEMSRRLRSLEKSLRH